jgi:hypothetical protein
VETTTKIKMSLIIPIAKIQSLVANHYPGGPIKSDTIDPKFDLIMSTVVRAILPGVIAVENIGNATRSLNMMIAELETVRDAMVTYLSHQVALDYLLWLKDSNRTVAYFQLFNSWCEVHPSEAPRELQQLALKVLQTFCPESVTGGTTVRSQLIPAVLNGGIAALSEKLDEIAANGKPDVSDEAPLTAGDVPALGNGLLG